MQTSQEHHSSGGFSGFYRMPTQEIEPFCLSHFQILDSNTFPNSGSQTSQLSFNTYNEQFFTLESSSAMANYIVYDSPSAGSISSSKSPFSSQGSQSYISDPRLSPDNTYGSPTSGSSTTDDGNELKNKLREIKFMLLGPEENVGDSHNCSFNGGVHLKSSMPRWNEVMQMIPRLNLKDVLVACAKAVSNADTAAAAGLMDVLGQMVSVSGEPIQRLGAYLLEGLRARLEFSGSSIYKSLKCEEPTSSELLSYMHVLYQICPFWKFAYRSANAVIAEAMENESRIHIIDFQIAQGSQWVPLIQDLALRPGGPPLICITGVDDSQSTHARGGGLHIIGKKLSELAASCKVPFEFHDAAMSGCEVKIENLRVRPGEAVAVNFPYVLHHMPDESVTTHNHRDQLLRLVKSLSPKVVTLVEQESNTNTSAFFPRFIETLDYYTAMFESMDVARSRDDKQRINAEQQCVARDIVNMIACEGTERVERHELLGKWRLRFNFAGFTPYALGPSVTCAVKDLLKEYNENYRVAEKDGALYLGWKNRVMSTCSAWK